MYHIRFQLGGLLTLSMSYELSKKKRKKKQITCESDCHCKQNHIQASDSLSLVSFSFAGFHLRSKCDDIHVFCGFENLNLNNTSIFFLHLPPFWIKKPGICVSHRFSYTFSGFDPKTRVREIWNRKKRCDFLIFFW